MLDIGGGSTAATRKDGGSSTPIGAVSLLEACGPDAAACRARAAAVFGSGYADWRGRTKLAAGGGTATALAMLELSLSKYDNAAIEAEIAELEDDEKQMFLADLGLDEPGLNRLIRAAYKLLGLQTYFTAGVKEVRAWTIHKNTKAVDAAAVIHSDIARGFIRAEIVNYDHFIAAGTMVKAKEAGHVRLEGKEYIMQDGDIVLFRFNV